MVEVVVTTHHLPPTTSRKQDEGPLGRKLHLLKEGIESEWLNILAPSAGCAGERG